MSLADQLTLAVPAIVGGVPILIKLASTMTVLFLVAGFYLGLTGTIHHNDLEKALAALSGLFALGAFILRQWGNFHRQSLVHQKELTDNIYYRNVNNNSGIFNYIIGEAEEQDWKEALLAYYVLLTAAAPLTREALGARVEELLARAFGVAADFEIDDALARLKGLDLVTDGGGLSAVPLADALARLDKEWQQFFEPAAGLSEVGWPRRVDLVQRRRARAQRRSSSVVERLLHRVEVGVQVVRFGIDEAERLHDLFGDTSRWADTVKPIQLATVTAMVPSFSEVTEIDLPVPCTYDLEVASARYLQGLDDGTIPLLMLFSGTVFVATETGYSVELVPWSSEASYRMPVTIWRDLVDAHFPGSAWLRCSRETLDALSSYKARNALPTWDATLTELLATAGRPDEPLPARDPDGPAEAQARQP